VGTPLARIGDGSASAAIDERATGEPSSVVERHPAPPLVRSPLVRHLAEERHVDLAQVHGSGPGGAVTRADVESTAAASPVVDRRVHASPYARRLADRLGLDLDRVHGSGPGGAIVARDLAPGPAEASIVPGAVPAAAPTPSVAATGPADSGRQAVAELMARSKREVPHYYLGSTIDLHDTMGWLASTNAGRPAAERIVPAAVLLRAVAVAAAVHPLMNGYWEDGGYHPADEVRLGVAVSRRGGGLVTPTIPEATATGIEATMRALRDLVRHARRGALSSSETFIPTLTVTDLGELGAESVFGVIPPPQVALVGFGRVVERPWAVDGMLAVRPVVTVTLSGDHRVSDGHDGSRFLAEVDRLLQRPDEL
jgi:pyruvate dehydrogenase E2 component (dihydrolipoamide acetyltransferase)